MIILQLRMSNVLTKLSEIWKQWSEVGIRWPYLFDPTTSQPSITLGLLYLTSILMLSSVLALHFVDGILTATLTSIMVWILAYVMYRLRRLDSFKLDLDDKSIQLNGSDESEGKDK